jgi:inosose dehydratase
MISSFSVGCQTIMWGPERNRHAMSEVLREVAAAEYDGVEIGARHLDLNRPNDFRRTLEAVGLRLVALHVGGDFLNPQSVASERGRINQVLNFLSALETEYLTISGTPKDSTSLEDFRQEAAELDQLGAHCRAHGVRLCYHNHYWEIENGAAGLRTLCEKTHPENVALALDVGWIERAGSSPLQVLQEFLDRVAYVHLKDAKDGEFVELGQGTVDFAKIIALLRQAERAWWLIAEQDTTRRTPMESARMSRKYLREAFGI